MALDVDGTLLDPATHRISPAVREAVHRVLAAGSQVVIATGRSQLATLPILQELDLTSGVSLCSNGAVVLDAATREVLSTETFDPGPAVAKLQELFPGVLLAAEELGAGHLVTGRFDDHLLVGPQHPVSPHELGERRVPRLIAHWKGHTPAEMADVLATAQLPACTWTLDHTEAWLTLVPTGVSKGVALEKLAAEMGITREDVLAAGDGSNDVQMLRWAGHSVAMGQAPHDIRAVADETTASVDRDGLALALNRWFR